MAVQAQVSCEIHYQHAIAYGGIKFYIHINQTLLSHLDGTEGLGIRLVWGPELTHTLVSLSSYLCNMLYMPFG